MDSPPDSQWKEPYHVVVTRHLPPTRKGVNWSDVVEETRHRPARYGPHERINRPDIASIEMQIVRDAIEYQAGHSERSPSEIIPRPNERVRGFWSERADVVGASAGEVTRYVYVEYGIDGNVHGRPMTAEQLRAMGVAI